MIGVRAWGAVLLGTALALSTAGCATPSSPARVPVSSQVRAQPSAGRGAAARGSGVPIHADDPSWGSSDAPVTIVAFLDYECPYSGEGYQTLSELHDRYKLGQLRIVLKQHPLPFHESAMPAALAAQAVYELGGLDAFLAYSELLFRNQRSLERANLAEWAEQVGVDGDTFRAHSASLRVREHVLADVKLADQIGAPGTPAFRINGSTLSGAMPIESFQSIIDRELAATAELLRQGVPAEDLYVRRVSVNLKVEPEEPDEEEPVVEEDTSIWRIPADGAPFRGAPDALVTMVEFSEFECPFCAMAEKTLAELLRRHPGQLRVVFRHLPFHEHAEPAAQLAIEARAQRGDRAFFQVAERLFAEQHHLDRDTLLRIAREAGLDLRRTQAALDQHKHRAVIEADEALADELDVQATPQFFINGRRLVGAQPIDRFEEVIAESQALAERLVAERGIAPKRVYATIMESARGPKEPRRAEIDVPPDSPSRGPADAPVVLQLFADLTCPYCHALARTLEALEKLYPTQLRIVWRHLPLATHPHARMASMAVLEAAAQHGPAAFWKMRELIEQGPGGTGPEELSRDVLESHADALGLDRTRFDLALKDGRHEPTIARDEAAAARANIRGTPTTLINGYVVEGLQSVTRFRRVIDLALERAMAASPAPKAASPQRRGRR
ncbi:MAG: thioredoxin domain-containing protein [Polyangiaceae bacterium]|nr:thioredoxin domain-containing protein [Polyangiaceae bacterium]